MLMISIITAFYQAEKYLSSCIDSVLAQKTQNWELLLINDGSTDDSKSIALSYSDTRIRYFEQRNQGVSVARNVGLAAMKGDYFCFLDADDVLPPDSLSARLAVFESDHTVCFVDGVVNRMDGKMQLVKHVWRPSFMGNPLHDLVHLTGKSFLGLTWMIKKKPNEQYRMKSGLTHGEDLLFYMQQARQGGQYAFTNKVVLHYRDSPGSAMKHLPGLEAGYRAIGNEIKHWKELNITDQLIYQFRFRKAMMLAYLRQHSYIRAAKSWW